jgi:dienelactone hydrolase
VFNRDCYIAEPEAGKEVKGIIVIISDAFGWQFVNNQIIADHYATRGDFKVYLPDFMDGGSIFYSQFGSHHIRPRRY